MFVFLLQVRDTLANGRVYLFTIFVTLVWVVWLRRVQLSRRYRPYTEDVSLTTSVIIPVVDEPEELFDEVLRRMGRKYDRARYLGIVEALRAAGAREAAAAAPGSPWAGAARCPCRPARRRCRTARGAGRSAGPARARPARRPAG